MSSSAEQEGGVLVLTPAASRTQEPVGLFPSASSPRRGGPHRDQQTDNGGTGTLGTQGAGRKDGPAGPHPRKELHPPRHHGRGGGQEQGTDPAGKRPSPAHRGQDQQVCRHPCTQHSAASRQQRRACDKSHTPGAAVDAVTQSQVRVSVRSLYNSQDPPGRAQHTVLADEGPATRAAGEAPALQRDRTAGGREEAGLQVPPASPPGSLCATLAPAAPPAAPWTLHTHEM
ncbi:uncharacterized protein LOC124969952 [Sciurus carolinensis]|uniref:uncharacterized protein LOC124969952 n=1 Tax=Sciurus carolinensis TaxID=30640 RepID=UPI001FB4BCB0|nr:uncharacterized protein LOC124969952 [Sciurus carolinensis]